MLAAAHPAGCGCGAFAVPASSSGVLTCHPLKIIVCCRPQRSWAHGFCAFAGRVFDFRSHLRNICGGQSITEYLLHEYSSAYDKARPAMPGYRGRYPAIVRSPDGLLRHTVKLRDGEIVPLPLGAQFEIICRQNTVEAALYYFARIERAWMDGSGDNSYRRSTMLMSLIGAPGCGERLH